jgi:hypothetical protein
VLEEVFNVIVVFAVEVPGVTLEGEKLMITPAGRLPTEKVTALLKVPLSEATVVTYAAEFPAKIAR